MNKAKGLPERLAWNVNVDPPKEGWYLATIESLTGRRYVRTEQFLGQDGWLNRYKVVAWQYLPKPFEE